MRPGKLKAVVAAALACTLLMGIVSLAGEISPYESISTYAGNDFRVGLQGLMDEPPIENWVDVRWWLAEGLHTDDTLVKNVEAIKDAGFGAMEFLAMPEEGAPDDMYAWGSEEWTHDTQLLIREATKQGLGFSLTSGTHWGNANIPSITADHDAAGKELDFTVETVAAGQARTGALLKPVFEEPNFKRMDLFAVLAVKQVSADEETGTIYLDDASKVVLTDLVTPDTFEDPTGEVPFELEWTAPDDGDYVLFSFWIHATGQTADPSATTNYTINYIDPYGVEALKAYWEETVLTPDLKDLIRENGRGEMYMDSIEIRAYGAGNQLWGYTMKDEFQNRRGYDITPYLPYILAKNRWPSDYIYKYEMADSDGVLTKKIRADLYETMTDMYIENILQPLREWLHGYNMKLRAEITYGVSYEISTPGIAVDDIETESYEFNMQPESFRTLSGAAHVYGVPFSSETGAYQGQNYRHPLNWFTQIMHLQFASGITRTVLHGYSAIEGSEGSTYWPGHEGMYDRHPERFGARQPAYQHYGDWTGAMARFQTILSQGQPQMDLVILRTDYLVNNRGADNRGPEQQLAAMLGDDYIHNHEGLYWKDMSLQDAGYTYDYLAPMNLEKLDGLGIADYRSGEGLVPDGPGYQAAIIYQDAMPYNSAVKILELAREGLPVVIVNNVTERLTTGLIAGITDVTYAKAASRTLFNDGKDEALAEVMAEMKALPNVVEIDDQAQTKEALLEMGIRPRAEIVTPNDSTMTVVRKTDDTLYLYAYNYMNQRDAAVTSNFSVNALGKPYNVNPWTNEVSEMGVYTQEGGRTLFDLTLKPGEAAVVAIDLNDTGNALHAVSTDAAKVVMQNGSVAIAATESGNYTTRLSDGTEVVSEVTVPGNIELSAWDLTVEDWNEGRKVVLEEDRGLGYITREVYFETDKTDIKVGETELIPWKDIPEVGPAVSGIGYYSASFELPGGWSEANGLYIDIGSTNGNTLAVYVNNVKTNGVDMANRTVDISGLVKPGVNNIEVEVSSPFANKLLSREYAPYLVYGLQPADYGMTGEVKLVTYTLAGVAGDAITTSTPEKIPAAAD